MLLVGTHSQEQSQRGCRHCCTPLQTGLCHGNLWELFSSPQGRWESPLSSPCSETCSPSLPPPPMSRVFSYLVLAATAAFASVPEVEEASDLLLSTPARLRRPGLSEDSSSGDGWGGGILPLIHGCCHCSCPRWAQPLHGLAKGQEWLWNFPHPHTVGKAAAMRGERWEVGVSQSREEKTGWFLADLGPLKSPWRLPQCGLPRPVGYGVEGR